MVKAVILGTAASHLLNELSLYNIIAMPSVAANLSHILTATKVEGCFPKNDGLAKTLKGTDIIIIPAGLPHKPDTPPQKNASIIRDLATGIAIVSPKAFILVISNPVNSTVPIIAETLKKHGIFNPKCVFGVTMLDIIHASTFVAEKCGDLALAKEVIVPVISGHSSVTIIPLLSRASHTLPSISTEEYDALVKCIQFGGNEVVQAKQGAGPATLLMAYAGTEFATKVLRAIKGEKGIVALTYVSLAADPHSAALLTKELGEEIAYFLANMEGVIKINPLGNITLGEKELIKAALPELAKNIAAGIGFVTKARL
ncbi:NAD-malate dehydrogenase [Macrolepiota fuliginosa MF-IS2]|uniref:malate dehydrogenase n=1 Tax=Macrolepiota fuliginosa MF-IS2 TaxID=1400762 RepID=A0A9P5WX86_9AGAR|nr:NAD-malate dehydrogenase [Macrolepiota fuliginosa MF-IS2]